MSRPALSVTFSKPLPFQVVKKPVGIARVWFAQEALDHVGQGAIEAGGEDVEPAVIVVVPGPARKTALGPIDAHG